MKTLDDRIHRRIKEKAETRYREMQLSLRNTLNDWIKFNPFCADEHGETASIKYAAEAVLEKRRALIIDRLADDELREIEHRLKSLAYLYKESEGEE